MCFNLPFNVGWDWIKTEESSKRLQINYCSGSGFNYKQQTFLAKQKLYFLLIQQVSSFILGYEIKNYESKVWAPQKEGN